MRTRLSMLVLLTLNLERQDRRADPFGAPRSKHRQADEQRQRGTASGG